MSLVPLRSHEPPNVPDVMKAKRGRSHIYEYQEIWIGNLKLGWKDKDFYGQSHQNDLPRPGNIALPSNTTANVECRGHDGATMLGMENTKYLGS